MGGGLRGDCLGLFVLAGALLAYPLDIFCIIFEIGLKHRAPAVQVRAALLERADLLPQVVCRRVCAVQVGCQLFGLRVERLLLPARLLQLCRTVRCVGLVLLRLTAQAVQPHQPQRNLQPAQLVAQGQILPRPLGLLAQRPGLALQLGVEIADTHQIVLGRLQAARSLLLAVAELGHARGLLKDLTAVLALERQDLVNTPLSDDRIAVAPKAGIHEQLMDVFEPAGLFIQGILAFARAVISPRDHDLCIIRAEYVVRVIQNQGDLGKSNRAALLGAAEDDVLHLGAAQTARGLFAQHPADGVRDVGFAAAVGSDDRGQAAGKADLCAVGKGFESLKDQTF